MNSTYDERRTTGYLARRLVIVLTACVLLTAIAVAYAFQSGRTEALLRQGAAHLEVYANETRHHLVDVGRDMDKQIRFLAQSAPVRGMVRARLAAGYDPWDGSGAIDLRNRLESTFAAFLQASTGYFQLRLLDMTGAVSEVVRVERLDDRVRVASATELRSQSGDDDLRRALRAAAGSTVFYPIAVNREQGIVEQPVRPSARAIIQIVGPDGKLFGALEMKREFGPGLAEPLARIPKQIRIYIANEQGDILFHPENGLAFAHEFVDTTGLGDLFPAAEYFLRGTSEDMVIVPRVGSGDDTWYLRRIDFDPTTAGQPLTIALRAPYELVSSEAHAALQHSVAVTIALVAAAVLLGIILGRRLTTPLRQLIRAAARIQCGQHNVSLPVDQPGELGVLARAFAEMAAEVRRREEGLAQLTVWLEQRVAERSAELRAQTVLLDLVVENIGEGVIVVDPHSHPCIINRAAQQILGIDGSAAAFEAWRQSRRFGQCEGDAASVDGLSPLTRALQGESVESRNLLVHSLDGKPDLRLTASARPLYDGARQLRGAVVTFRDITAQHDADVAQRLAAMVFEHSAQGVLVTDASQRILRVNKAFTAITGYSAEAAVGQTPKLLNAGIQSRSFYDRLWATIVQNGFWEGELWNRRRNGERYAEHLSVIGVRDDDDKISHYVGMFSDVTERKHNEDQIYRLAHYDGLSGLPNRLLFKDRLQHAIDRSRREGKQVAVLFIDLDRFKPVNDTFGHAAGDNVLGEVAARLLASARDADTVARFGGDEFAVALEGVDKYQADAAAQRFLSAIRRPIPVNDQHVHLGASIGISMYPEDGDGVEELLQFSDLAMYRVKERGRNSVCFFRSELFEIPGRRLRLEQRLRDAIENEQLELHFQPQVELVGGRIVGAEALLRWHDEELGWIAPSEFVHIAEDTGLIVPLGDWVWRTACAQRAALAGRVHEDFRIAVNLSPRQLEDENLAQRIIDTLAAFQVWPEQMELEITENALMRDPAQAGEFLQRLSEQGVGIAMDDFGSGYSSLAYIKRFPIDRLKVDRAFVRDVPHDADDCAIVRTVVAMAHSLRLQVIAEGVENSEQLSFLASHGCDEFQGYLCCKPAPAAEFEALLRMGDWKPERAEPLMPVANTS